MDLGLRGKRALVTAASQGLGRAVATELVREGCTVVISSRRIDKLRATAAEICAETGAPEDAVCGIAADVAAAADVERLVADAVSWLGGLDLLVTNAGGPPGGTFEQVTDAQWLAAVELNLLSVVRLVRASLPALRSAGGGRILNVSSMSVREPIPSLILSNTVRTATMAMLKTLALEVAADNIQVLNLAPGRIETDRVVWLDSQRAKRENRPLAEVQADERARIPMGRYGTPAEFGRLAAFLLSPANGYMTGQTILVDGGVIRAL
ncbi:MAG: SDR family oxidoreductase [Alicyclobacillus sp.]|nr:SDR family oxidoreductase [Alicyclobacillus sp.]